MKVETIIDNMIIHAQKVVKYCEEIESPDDFLLNSVIVEACVFNLIQTGELANKLDKSFTEKHPGIPWRELYGPRNRITHDYEGVNFILVWDIIKCDLPGLIDKLKLIK